MKKKTLVNLMILLIFNTFGAFGQSKTDTIVLKKGEVLDVLWLTRNPNTEEARPFE